LGAGYAVSEMVTSKRELWASLKTSRRADHTGEVAPIAVQIAGVDAAEMADAARYNIDRGAQIIDINMGCPAKKVCNNGQARRSCRTSRWRCASLKQWSARVRHAACR
jgi:tRNA-dihydrouridine synthase B